MKSRFHLCIALLATIFMAVGPAFGQGGGGHLGHHPAAGGASPAPTDAAAQPAMPLPGGNPPGVPAGGAGGMGAGMGEMMDQMGKPPRKEVYPSLMALPDKVTPEARADIDKLAHDRMKTGVAQISSGLGKLTDSTSKEDYPAMQQASEQMRAGLAEYQAGVAALRVLSEGQAPRNVALDWFKREMNLATPVQPEGAHTLLGVAPFHFLTMVILIAFGLAMLAMYFFKMRRAAALFGRIDPDKKPPPGGDGPAGGKPGGGQPKVDKPADGKPAAAPVDGSKTPPAAPPIASPDAAIIAGRAGELWKARGSPVGSAKVDWLQAEEELASAGSTVPAPVTANWKGRLRIGNIIAETASLKTFRLLPSSSDRFLPFTFLPGQFLNVTFWIGGAKMNRSYSIASSPTQREYIELAIRREPRGAVSRHIDDLLKVGDEIEAGGPVGKFTFTGTEAGSIVLISAGVGITPMMSITRFLTERKWSGDIFFVYTCSKPADFIFADESAALQRLNPKLHVAVTISKPEGTNWTGARGRITKEWLLQTVPDLAARRTHLCGPPLMMDSIKAIFTELGIPPDQLKTEVFGATKPAPAAAGTSAKPTAPATGPLVTFSKNGKSAKIRIDLKAGDSPPKQSILELSEELDIGIEFSCRVGTCGVCKVKMASGEVDMEVQDALDDNDKATGIILACQAKPKSEVSVEA